MVQATTEVKTLCLISVLVDLLDLFRRSVPVLLRSRQCLLVIHLSTCFPVPNVQGWAGNSAPAQIVTRTSTKGASVSESAEPAARSLRGRAWACEQGADLPTLDQRGCG